MENRSEFYKAKTYPDDIEAAVPMFAYGRNIDGTWPGCFRPVTEINHPPESADVVRKSRSERAK